MTTENEKKTTSNMRFYILVAVAGAISGSVLVTLIRVIW